MTELIRRLTARPFVTTELVLATLFANLLALASPLFVMQVLNRYVTYGVDATLATLTVGVLGAIGLEYSFRQARFLLISHDLGQTDRNRAVGAFGILISARSEALDRIPPGQRREILRELDHVETAYGPTNLGALFDIPFALLFLTAIALLSPALAGVVFLFILIVVGYSAFNQHILKAPAKQLSETANLGNRLANTTHRAADTVRAFNGGEHLVKSWRDYVTAVSMLRKKIANIQGRSQTVTASTQAIMGVAVIAIGAILVVHGAIDTGTLMGANILAARALGPVVRLVQLGEALAKAEQALKQVHALAGMPTERDQGTALKSYTGAVEFKGVDFGFPQQASLVEGLNLKIAAGAVLVITGRNGTGKTTLARLLVGLIQPAKGQVLIDGVDLRQLVPSWWRRQVLYLPQEPSFFDGTIRDNLHAANPDLDDDGMLKLLERAQMLRFVDESPNGLGTEIVENGYTLALGLRRKLALARALASHGKLAIFDEPTEGLDDDGRVAVYTAMKDLSVAGCTMIVMTSDPQILRGARLILDLNAKPMPRLLTVPVANSGPVTPGPITPGQATS
jgi:ATP-binding cassette subfamily C protein LapB